MSVANNFVDYHLQEMGHLEDQSIRRVQLNISSNTSLVYSRKSKVKCSDEEPTGKFTLISSSVFPLYSVQQILSVCFVLNTVLGIGKAAMSRQMLSLTCSLYVRRGREFSP